MLKTQNGVQGALARTLEIFEIFGAEQKPLSLSEIARAIGAPASSCHLLLRALLGRGYLYSLGRRKLYYPTRRLYDVACGIATHDALIEELRPVLAGLRDRSGETVILGKRQGDAVLYLEVLESAKTVRYTARAGEYKPLHSSAIGKALLGALQPDVLGEWLRSRTLERVTPQTLASATQLKANLQQGRSRGYFVTRGENVIDVMAIAAAVALKGETFGLAIAGPVHRMEPALSRHAELLLGAVRRIKRERAK
ncbi:MAG: IclR family transcriptional regulator [Betaproteobacteria bacterium]|nr:IclR family transcriptional regulator [Betaproteobacteria bacterium]